MKERLCENFAKTLNQDVSRVKGIDNEVSISFSNLQMKDNGTWRAKELNCRNWEIKRQKRLLNI